MNQIDIIFVVSKLNRVGPTNQTLNIMKAASKHFSVGFVTLFEEDDNDTMLPIYNQCGFLFAGCLKLHSFFDYLLHGRNKLDEILGKIKPRIIHSYGILPDCLCSKFRNRYPHIITLRNFPKEDIFTRMKGIKGFLAYKMHIKTLKNCRHLVCCSKTILNKMVSSYKLKFPVSSIQNGVDTDRFYSNSYSFRKNEISFLCACNIIPRKRVGETIEGFLNSSASKHNAKLIIAGDGVLLNELQAKYKNPSIVFLGKVEKMEDLMSKAEVFVTSSESEGMPNSMLEALSSGCYIIASDISQHLEAYDSIGFKGLFYPLGDVAALSSCFDKALANDFVEIKKFNREQTINSPLSSAFMGEQYCDYYKQILNTL